MDPQDPNNLNPDNLRLINSLLNLVIMIVFWWVMDRVIKLKTGKGIFERLVKGQLNIATKNEPIEAGAYPNYQRLFDKFCELTNKTPLEVFLLARTEYTAKGFGWSDAQVKKHFDKYITDNRAELPNYVESFLDEGRNFITNTEE